MTNRTRALALVLALASVAAADAERSRDARPIVPAGPGPNRLALDVPLLAGARPLRYDAAGSFVGGLEDLRLFDGEGREVPYLVVPPAAPVERWENGRIEPVHPTEESSGFEVELGAVVSADRVRLAGLPTPLLKRVRVEGGGDRTRWIVLADDATVFDLPDEHLRRLEIAFPVASVQFLRLTWDDRASGRVPLPSAVAVRVAVAGAALPPVRAPLVFERRPSEPATSRFRIHLPGPGLPIRALWLDCGGDRLLRTARVTEPRLVGDAVAPRTLGSATLRRVVQEGLVAADLRVPVAAPTEPEIELVVDDGDNPPLELAGVEAELPALPWLYFESPDGKALTARFGASGLEAPRYDLEALRDAVRDAAPPAASWGEVVHAPAPEVPPPPPPEGIVTVGAPLDVSAFRHVRPLPAGSGGLVALRLDVAALAHSNGLADVRVVDPTDRQVPYVVEHVDEPLALDLPPLAPLASADGARGVTVYELRLPYPRLPPARLVLETNARVFERRVVLRVERPAADARSRGTADGLETLRSVTWRHVDPDRPAPALTIEVPSLPTATVRLEIDDGDNSPLPLRPPRLLLPTRRLRFVRVEGAALTLVYGARGIAAPRYDLALLAGHIVGGPATEIEAAAESDETPEPADDHGTMTERRVFWAALVVAVIVLLLVLARLLRFEAPRDATGGGASAPP